MGLSPEMVYVAVLYLMFVTATDVNLGCENDKNAWEFGALVQSNPSMCCCADISDLSETPQAGNSVLHQDITRLPIFHLRRKARDFEGSRFWSC